MINIIDKDKKFFKKNKVFQKIFLKVSFQQLRQVINNQATIK